MTTKSKTMKHYWKDPEYKPSYTIPPRKRSIKYIDTKLATLALTPIKYWKIRHIEEWADFLCAYYDERLKNKYYEEERRARIASNPAYALKRKANKNSPAGKLKQRLNREADLIKAKPSWSNDSAIRSIYIDCYKLNIEAGYCKYHVDHIVPLRGKLNKVGGKIVSGLHCESNLTILLAADNLKKGCHFNPETYTQ